MVDVAKSLVGGKTWATYQESVGNQVRFYHLSSDDAAGSSGAFHDIEEAITQAQIFIFIADWSFHPNTRLRPGSPPVVTSTIGYHLNERAKAGVLVAIHTWDHTNAGAPDPQNDNGNTRLDALARATDPNAKRRSSNLLWRASSRTGIGWSLHQKFIVLDGPGSGGKRCIKLFLGGLDLTRGRFETPSYPVDARGGAAWRTQVVVNEMAYDDWYNAEFIRSERRPNAKKGIIGEDEQPGMLNLPRQPWEDYQIQLVGPSAWDAVREFVGRWEQDPSWFVKAMGDHDTASKDSVLKLFQSLFDRADLLRPWEAQSGPFVARMLRSLEKPHWGPRDAKKPPEVTGEKGNQKELVWTVSGNFERSIQEAYLTSIAKADRFIYIENQYLIGDGASWSEARPSVKNRVPQTIVRRIVEKIESGQPFHVYIVVPMFPESDPMGGAAPAIRSFEWRTMRYMAQAVFKAANAKGKSWSDYLSFYFLANWTDGPLAAVGDRQTRVGSNCRYMVYVHSKLMIIDDEFLLIGSANLNERSLAGDRDAEVGIYLRAGDGQLATCKDAIKNLRRTAWTRLLGSLPSGWESPNQPSCIADIQTRTTSAYVDLRLRVASPCRMISFPFYVDDSAFYVRAISLKQEDPFIVDAPVSAPGRLSPTEWMWGSPLGLTSIGQATDLGE